MPTYIFAHKGSRTVADDDLNSCSVIALEHAFPLTKGEATEYCALFGRKKNDGMYGDSFHKMVTYLGAKLIGIFGTTKSSKGMRARIRDIVSYQGISFGTLLKQQKFQKGTYILYVTGHFTVIKDGVLYDPNDYLEAGTSVIAVWEV